MFLSLPPDRYELIRPLVIALDHHLILEAVIIGYSPAAVFVDCLDTPQTAFIKSPEGDFLVGEPNNEAFNAGLIAWIEEHLIKGTEDEVVFESVSESWVATVKTILARRPPLAYERYYYETSGVKLTPPPLDPAFKLQFVTPDFIAQTHIKNIAVVQESITSNWTSAALFFAKGFGYCILHDDEVVSWSVVDCVAEKRCEIGIHTAPEFQRRGLATALIATVVEYAISHGFQRIGWHCWVDNWGSIGVAEKVGLVQKQRYMAYIALHNEMINHAFAGSKSLQVQDYSNAEGFYEAAIRTANAESRYFLPRVYFEQARVQAGLGKDEAALNSLHEAVRLGLQYTEKMFAVAEFAHLHKTAAWQALFGS